MAVITLLTHLAHLDHLSGVDVLVSGLINNHLRPSVDSESARTHNMVCFIFIYLYLSHETNTVLFRRMRDLKLQVILRLTYLLKSCAQEDISKLSPQFTGGQVEPILPPDTQLQVVRRRAEVIHPKSFFQVTRHNGIFASNPKLIDVYFPHESQIE